MHTISGVVQSNLLGPDPNPLAYTATLVVAANLRDIDFFTRPMKTLGTPKYYQKITQELAKKDLVRDG